MNNIEDLPRDAYDSPAQTVRPESVRRHDEQSAVISPPGRRRRPGRSLRVMGPLAAAAVVAAVILGTVVVPQALLGDRSARPSGPARHGQPPTSAATSPASRFAVTIFGETGTPLAVHSVRTGAVVARIRPPRPGMSFAAVATGDGRIYVVVLARPGVCRSWLYQFRLNGGGRPGALTPYALPSVGQLLGPIAVSKDDKTFAYRGERCAGSTGATESDLAAVNVATLRTRAWAISKRADVSSLSLTGNGGVLAYNIDLTRHVPSAGLVLPTNAAPGAAAQRSRVVVAAAQFGASAEISSDVITRWRRAVLQHESHRLGRRAGLAAPGGRRGRRPVAGRAQVRGRPVFPRGQSPGAAGAGCRAASCRPARRKLGARGNADIDDSGLARRDSYADADAGPRAGAAQDRPGYRPGHAAEPGGVGERDPS